MKIATITLNPAIDQTVSVNDFHLNTVNRGQSIRYHAGGKGVNVASFLADCGYSVCVTGFLGQDNARIFEQFFTFKGINDHFVRLPGNTRTGVKIVDEANNQTTDINMPGLAPSEEAVEALLNIIDQLAKECDWFVLAGALPPGVPVTLYATIINRLKQQGKLTVLDASGDALREGLLAGPTIVKPNIDELQQLVGYPLAEISEIEQAVRQLLAKDIKLVVVSMGEVGALFVDMDFSLLAIPPVVHVKSTVGAGDAMVAGLLTGKVQDLNLDDCARLATAFALGRITQVGSQLPTPAMLQMFVNQVTVQKLTTVSRSV
jgi:1-phosphofructokinase